MKSFYTGKSLFTWAGAKINRTIALMCKLRVHQDVDYNNLMIYGISPKHISDILSQQKPSGDELAALMSREEKKKQQYDHYLSEDLLNHEYACTYLAVDKAWALLEKLKSEKGYDDYAEAAPSVKKETKKMDKYDFRHIQDISNVRSYNTLSESLNTTFKKYLADEGYQIEVGAMFANAPEHAMPINFLLTKGDRKVAILLMGFRKTKRYSVQETEALCRENGVKVLRFFFECENEKDYVVERIRKEFN